jgi:hypothetical protein
MLALLGYAKQLLNCACQIQHGNWTDVTHDRAQSTRCHVPATMWFSTHLAPAAVLVAAADKQLQWLRDSTYSAGSSSSSSGSSASGSVPVMAPQQLGPSSSTSPAVPPHPAQADVTLNMGYRPIAIPTELFERWSNMGTTTKPAAAAAVAAVGESGSGIGSSSALASKAASRRTTGTLEAAAAAAGKQGASAGSPFASRPTSGHETVAAGVGGGAPHAASRAAAGGGGGAGSMLQDSAAEGGYSVPSRRLSAGGGGVQEGRRHSVPTRQRTADSHSECATGLSSPGGSCTLCTK